MKPTMWAYYLYRFVGLIVPPIPVRLGHWLAGRIGGLVARLRPQERAVVRSNIRQMIGDAASDEELDRMTYQTYRNMMKNYFDLFWLPPRSAEDVLSRVDFEGWENYKAAIETGRGVIIASLHYGNAEMILQVVPALGVPCVAPAEHIQPEALFQYFCNLRGSHGLRLIPVDGPMLDLVRALRRGEAIGLALDRDPTSSGRLVEFFGRPAQLPDGAARLALRTGAPILLCIIRRLPKGRYALKAFPPFYFAPEKQPDDAMIEGAMSRILGVAEEEMRKDPSQWVVFRPIWND